MKDIFRYRIACLKEEMKALRASLKEAESVLKYCEEAEARGEKLTLKIAHAKHPDGKPDEKPVNLFVKIAEYDENGDPL